MNVLITNAFVKTDECLAIANAIGMLNKRVFSQVNVHPAITNSKFQTARKENEYQIWVHFGHGNEHLQLQESCGNWCNIVDWFLQVEKKLELIVLLSCYSSKMASRLKDKKYCDMAVGFGRKVNIYDLKKFFTVFFGNFSWENDVEMIKKRYNKAVKKMQQQQIFNVEPQFFY